MGGFHYSDSEISTISRVSVKKSSLSSIRAHLVLKVSTRESLRVFCSHLSPPRPMAQVIKLSLNKYLMGLDKVKPYNRGEPKRGLQVILSSDQDLALRLFCENWGVSKGEAVTACIEKLWEEAGFVY